MTSAFFKTSVFSVFVSTAFPAVACDTALLLAIDVSNSIDVGEYRLQTDGMADAVLDPDIMENLVQGQVSLAVMQWSGTARQDMTIPWVQIRTEDDVRQFSTRARDMPRAFVMSDTAPAEAIFFAIDQFDSAPACTRQVIDISGDGAPNAGSDTRTAARAAERRGITINGIAIESLGLAVTNFYRQSVITRDGFVITAIRHLDYPRAIREKILRETARALG